MGDVTIPDTGGVASELVWDAERHATLRLPPNTTLAVGADEGVPPDSMLAAAADAALMIAFLDCAEREGIEVLGYVSATRFEAPEAAGGTATLVLLPTVLVATADAGRADALLRAAFREAPLLQRLGTDILLEGDVEGVAPNRGES